MGRSAVRRVEQPKSRRAIDRLFLAGIILVLLFAAVGVFSAGNFLAGHLGTGTKPVQRRSAQTHANPTVAASLSRAHAQSTAIVKAAQAAARQIVVSATTKAKKQSNSILAKARQVAASQSSSAQPRASAGVPSSSSAPQALSTPAPSTGATIPSSPATGSASTPNLSGVPSSWLVVGYNATFGSGPGTAGSITVINRSPTPFSGVAAVVYNGHAGRATAPFSGLAPGQTEVLPLDGPTYPGTGYHIVLLNVHR